ncbi:unnamed protein product [Rhizoctonia solani]|uniref:Uncharacterized protein n=1 Tax=Rhizoctonia solani TaxID=456999 RepID=A0A8H3GEM7_9AGAM|nr:unnamed protein product [Rhizoctonia solani]
MSPPWFHWTNMVLQPVLFAVQSQYIFLLATLQCLLQGSLLSMLSAFFSSRTIVQRPLWFRAYVLLVNTLSFTQTVLVVAQGFKLFSSVPPTRALGNAFTMLTTIIGISVQLFFIHRCWRIFNKRVLPVVPLVLINLASFVSGILAESFENQGSTTKVSLRITIHWEQHRRLREPEYCSFALVVIICLSCAFVVYVSVTATTIVFLYRTRTGLREHDGIFNTIWQVIWASAAPPLIALTINIVNGYIVKSGPHALTFMAGCLNAKFCNLSLMINLIGQGHIRRKFESRVPNLPTISTSQTPGIISEPVFAISMTNLNLGAENIDQDKVSSSVGALHVDDASWAKPDEPEARRSTHQVRFSLGP